MATDLFANRPTTTVISGGTTAPSGGTVETWTVASAALFPAASSGAGTQFHVADAAQPSEVITVTNVAGTTWTVTRGAESTVPVAHAGNFTIWEVVSAGDLTAFVQNPMTATGDLITGGSAGVPSVLPGNTSATNEFLTSAGTGSTANLPAWAVIGLSDLPAGVALLGGAQFTGEATPAVVALTDAATIVVNAAAGNHFRVTLGGNRILGTPASPLDGQKIIFEVIQDVTGSRTLSYSGAYAFGTGLGTPVLTATAGKRDFIGFSYNSTSALWYCLAFASGY